MPFFHSQLISAQPRHFTELKTRNSTIKLEAIAKGIRLGTLSTSKFMNAAAVLTLGLKEQKAEKTGKLSP